MVPYFLESVFALSDLPVVTDIRGYGLMAGIDLAPGAGPGARGTEVMKNLFAAGLHLKFTGDCALAAPPLVAEKSDIDDICGILREVLGKYS